MLPVGKILADIGEGCWLLTLVGGGGGGGCLLVRYLLALVRVGKILADIGEGCWLLTLVVVVVWGACW